MWKHGSGLLHWELRKGDFRDELTAAQIRGILLRTSRPLAGADYNWRQDAGFGVIDAEEAIKDAITINQRKDRT